MKQQIANFFGFYTKKQLDQSYNNGWKTGVELLTQRMSYKIGCELFQIIGGLEVSWTTKEVSASEITAHESDLPEKQQQGNLCNFFNSFWGEDMWGHFVTKTLDPKVFKINGKNYLLSGSNDSLKLEELQT